MRIQSVNAINKNYSFRSVGNVSYMQKTTSFYGFWTKNEKKDSVELSGTSQQPSLDIADLVNEAKDNMYERLGIYEQMDNGTFVDKPLDDLELISDDFEKVIK